MGRLTDKNITFAEKETLEKFREEREHWQEFTTRMGRIENKLKEIEDLEEQLGNNFSGKNSECSFNMLFMATQNGFWYQVQRNKFIHLVPDDNHSIIYDWNGGYPILQYMEVTKDFAYTIQCVYDVYLTDYKKKFWLKEDRSE